MRTDQNVGRRPRVWNPLRRSAHIVGTGLIVGTAWAHVAAAATSDYIMEPGDVIAISVAGVPELSASSPIDIDGKISIPLLGRLDAAGMPLSELEKSIDRLLPAQAYRQRTQDGTEKAVFISPQQISVSFAQYRPIYVGGDVAHPGQLPFQPSMTVGDAISAAGGYDLVRFRANDPYLYSADLRNDYQTQWTELAAAEAKAWRLRTELGEQADLRSGDFDQTPIGKKVLTAIEQAETNQLKFEQDDHEKQRAYLMAAIQEVNARSDILKAQQTKEAEGAKADEEDVKRWSNSFQQGTSTYLRFEDARRAALYSATQLLQTSDSLALVEKAGLDLNRNLVQLDDERRIKNLSDLKDVNVQIAELRSQLQATSDKVLHVGVLRSQLVRGVGGGVTLAIVRQGKDGQRSSMSVDDTTQLVPGDRLEAVLAPQSMGTAATQ